MAAVKRLVVFVVGAIAGACLTWRATRLEVELARANGYLRGGLRAMRIQDEVRAEHAVTHKQRRRWFS